MNYFITTLVVIVFLYIVLKKRAVPALRKLVKAFRNRSGKAEPECRPALPGNPAHTRFEVLAFFTSESANSVEFRERIEMRLNNAARKLEDSGTAFDAYYTAVGDALVIILCSRPAERSIADGNGNSGNI